MLDNKKILCNKCFSTHGCACVDHGLISVDREMVKLVQVVNNSGMKTHTSSSGSIDNLVAYITIDLTIEHIKYWTDLLSNVNITNNKYANVYSKVTPVEDKLMIKFTPRTVNKSGATHEHKLKALHKHVDKIYYMCCSEKVADVIYMEEQNNNINLTEGLVRNSEGVALGLHNHSDDNR